MHPARVCVRHCRSAGGLGGWVLCWGVCWVFCWVARVPWGRVRVRVRNWAVRGVRVRMWVVMGMGFMLVTEAENVISDRNDNPGMCGVLGRLLRRVLGWLLRRVLGGVLCYRTIRQLFFFNVFGVNGEVRAV